MGKVTDQLKELLAKQIDKRGIVVWYDPQMHYKDVAPRLNIENTTFVAFEGSYFAVRREVEPLLAADERPRLLVYVPAERQTRMPPLIELECAGTVCEPGAPTGRNTKLEVVARAALKAEGWPTAKIEEEVANIASGYHDLEDVERIIEQGPVAGTGALALVYNTSASSDIALKFLVDEALDQSLVSKNGIPELSALLETVFGLSAPKVREPEELRTLFTRHVLLTDFVAALPKGVGLEALSSVPLPTKKVHRDACVSLAEMCRVRSDLRECYAKAADAVEADYNLAAAEIEPKHLTEASTFRFVEARLLAFAQEMLLAGRWSEARSLAKNRTNTFWSTFLGSNALHWSLLSTAADLLSVADRVCKQAKERNLTAADMVAAYAGRTDEAGGPWCELDFHQRVLEKHYAEFDVAEPEQRDLVERVVNKARDAYTQAANDLAERFTDALEKAGFELPNCRSQCEVFKTEVAPHLGTTKVAYFLVDALRYEMARELMGSLDEECSIAPSIATAPTLTVVGMAALLPGAESGLGIVRLGESSIGADVGGAAVKDRASRVALLESRAGYPTAILTLGDVVRLRKPARQKIEKADLIVVTSQEIDELCERGEELMARQFMDDVLGYLKRAVKNLAGHGVERIVIAADHGFIFGEALGSGMKIDPPGGKTVELHRRVWIGLGGTDSPSYLRTTAGELGLRGELEFAFPRSLAAFKVRGGGTTYFHGGLSLQELVVPVLVVLCKKPEGAPAEGMRFELEIASSKITTRMFTVKASYSATGLFAPDKVNVSFRVMKGGKPIGAAATAMYGFQEGANEVVLRKGEPNHVTLLLKGDDLKGKVSVRMVDADTQVELKRLDDIELAISL